MKSVSALAFKRQWAQMSAWLLSVFGVHKEVVLKLKVRYTRNGSMLFWQIGFYRF